MANVGLEAARQEGDEAAEMVSARTQKLDRPPASALPIERTPPPVSHDDPTLIPSDRHPTRPDNATDSWDRQNLPGLPEHIGRFKVRRRLGAGGMGLVFEAHDQTLDRKVAVKLLRTDGGGSQSDEASTRLLREAQALARVSHPNIIQVYEVGTYRGQVFVAMEFIDGETLDVWQRDPDLGWSEILQVYLDAARGLAAAHDAGIVHRDFKPANVMRARDGRVVVLDFGLARHTDAESFDDAETRVHAAGQSSARLRARIEAIRAAESSQALPEHLATPLTATGAVMGTPAYMSPEQHEGLPTDHRTDQFSLCVALWEGLYGERPFEGPTLALLTSAVLEGRIRKLPEYSTQVPTAIQDALLVGLAVEPNQRYADINALIEALDRGPASWVKRRRGYLAAATLVGSLSVGWAASGWEGSLTLDEERARFSVDLAQSKARGERLGRQGHAAEASSHWDALVLGHAREALEADPTEAIASLRHLTPGNDAWVPAARVIAAQARARGVAWRSHELGVVSELYFTSLGDRVLYLDDEGHLRRWEIEKNVVAYIESSAPVTDLALAGHGRLALARLGDGSFVEIQLNSDGTSRVSPTGISADCEPTALASDQEGQHLFVACGSELVVWQRGGEGWSSLARHDFASRIVDLVAVGSELAVLHGRDEASTLSAASFDRGGIQVRELALGLSQARGLVAAHRISELAIVASSGLLAVPEAPAQSAPVLRTSRAGSLHDRGAAGMVSADGKRISVRASTGNLDLRGHAAPLRFLRASEVEARILSVDATGHARVWRPGTATPRIPLHGAGGIVTLDISERGDVLIAGAGDGSIHRIPLGAVGMSAELLGKHPGELRMVFASPDGSRVASVGREPGIRVWGDVDAEAQRFGVDRQAARSVRWADDGSVVAAGACTIAEGCGAELFWPASGRSVWIDGLDRAPIALSMDPRSQRLAAVEPLEAGARIWLASLDGQDAHGGEKSFTFEKLELELGRVEAIEHDAQGWLTIGALGQGSTLELWRVDPKGRAARLSTLDGVDMVTSDHGVLAWQSDDRIQLYDLESHEATSLLGFETPLAAMMMRRGGKAVALFSEIDDGALAIDLKSRERRVIDVREPPLAWGLDFFDAPGTSLRAFDDRAPQDADALLEWISAQSKVWVDPAKMHRSVLPEPESE
jgi:serine/threonine protein kinase